MASEFYRFPCFPKTVPDQNKLVSHDKNINPPDKYKVLEDVQDWTTNVGYPGYLNAATSEIFGSYIISTMFQKAASGELSPEDALKEADKKVQAIFKKWRDKGVL